MLFTIFFSFTSALQEKKIVNIIFFYLNFEYILNLDLVNLKNFEYYVEIVHIFLM